MNLSRKKFIDKFEDLEVFKIAYPTSLDIHKVSYKFPRSEQFELANQIRRASKSICANIAEGFAKQSKSKPEFRRFLSIAIGSCSEMYLWLKYCFDLEYINKGEYEKFINNYRRIYGMLVNIER